MINKKIEAGALQLVIFIVVVIGLLLFSFVLLVHTHKLHRIKTEHIIDTVKMADNGIGYALLDGAFDSDTISVKTETELNRSLDYHKSYWGTFEKVYSRSRTKNTIVEKVALTGNGIDSNEPTALYLRDNNRPLVLVGYTKIEGRAFIPKRGVKSGNIAGRYYYNEKYIYGSTNQSSDFPSLNKKLSDYIKGLNQTFETKSGKTNELIDLGSSRSHSNSFKRPLKKIYDLSEIHLMDTELTGNIIVQSKTKITVDRSAKLTDVLLVAPFIEIEAGVKGNFQAIASERITLHENVKLEYPSALVLTGDNEKNKQKSIRVMDNTIVKGNILVLGKNRTDNHKAQLKIHPNATFEGTVYCQQNLELRGTVLGSVYTDNFIIKEAGSIYQNHLYNARIDSYGLNSEFIGPGIDNNKKGVAKWLY